jgi:multidrug efflux pump subunit AcrA (membrane-fusion protein)
MKNIAAPKPRRRHGPPGDGLAAHRAAGAQGKVVSSTDSSAPQARQHADTPAAAEAGASHGQGRLVAAGLVIVVAAGALSAWRAGVFSAAPGSGGGHAAAASTALVTRQDLSATTPIAATLGYAGTYTVTGQGGGTLTSLPSPGQVISQGQPVYQTGNGSPVVLLYGAVPDWRPMSDGTTGADVSQLNHDLVALGYASRPNIAAVGWDYYSASTAYAVQQLEEHLGVAAPPGSLALGQVVFEPAAIRVTQVTGSLGGPAAGPVLQATSDEPVVTIALDVSQELEVVTGDAVTVTLPDGTTSPGVVTSVGTVATTSAQQQGQNAATTIPVTVALSDPSAAGHVDQAPVTVNITTATARDVLAVPVTALLARTPGGYVVEVAGPHGTRRYVPVTPGIFDDNTGLVQVSGALTPGQRVVVASS